MDVDLFGLLLMVSSCLVFVFWWFVLCLFDFILLGMC